MTQLTAPDLFEPGLFEGTGFYDVFAWYRANDPVSWQRPAGDPDGFWSVTRYHDVVSVHRDSTRMSSAKGMRLGSADHAVGAVANKMLIVADPPDHTRMKRVLIQPFSNEVLSRAEEYVEEVVAGVVATAVRHPGPDLIEQLERIPTDVICAIMGLPRADWEWIGRKTTEAFESPSEVQRITANGEIFKYFSDLVRENRRTGTNAFISGLTARNSGGTRVTDEELVFNLSGILAGGNETTRFTLAALTLQLAQHPDQWDRVLRGDVEPAVATEEALRWSVPGMHVLRTATEALRIGDVEVEPGQRVVTWIGSANRDPEVFDDPDTFDVGRSGNRHLSFGAGRHMCLGSRLARLEITAYLRTLRVRVRSMTLEGEPRYNGSNFTWGLNRLPVVLHA
ncbi:cytochrome P450 [Streptomyces sp. TRM S81-3]|uniref:Cytochrome P450 n=1 Tax=Streptomyces griseicoloratus TaxID=2752516 RepID=A0A926QSD9_9ACTN|nr:cytochrome P450 [Streptomyces griseicoloratus]MBD0422889.1 cytochrome P450 [Streptomyces griseicoloratus]